MSSVSREYSQALFILAVEKDSANTYCKALDTVIKVVSENPRYTELLSSPVIPLEERIGIIETSFKGLACPDVVNFLKLLCERKHIGEIFGCVKEYKAMLDESKKVSKARVTSRVELLDEQKAALIKKLEKKCGHRVIAEYASDKSIIGGFIIELDGKMIDASVDKHLKDIKDVISK